MNNELNHAVGEIELQAFLLDLNSKRKAYFAAAHPGLYGLGGSRPYEDHELLAARIGRKNIKIVVTSNEPGYAGHKADDDGGYSRSVYCFIDKATGNILKAAGFNAPAKGVRGNIRQPYWGTALTPYGAAYLR